ncbi:MAG: hypothetical protein CVU41_05510 [Chloroflexi bacterium HGW-Chloroflexi-3]|nr:MAG: hypothetical protein CVU41_05510 [Chloroflexi bacterium HGW-Chloroflexi-3]
MKKLFVLLTLVILMSLVITSPVMAGNGNGRGSGGGQQSFALPGYITTIGDNTITVQAINDRFAGQVLTINVTSSTRFLQWTPSGTVPITFDDIAVGDSINIKGTITNGEYIATRVTVDVPLYCFE